MSATMATEAQRLYSISLTKIARSRTHRNGVSLHKNLLVATVLQRARFQIYMEDVHHMWQTSPSEKDVDSEEEEETTTIPSTEEYGEMPPSPSDLCTPAADDSAADKENQLPNSDVSEPTYLDLDSRVRETGSPTINVVLRERSNCDAQSLKRRHAVSEWETEEAVLSILPKRAKCDATTTDDTTTSNNNSEAETSDDEDDSSTSMEIDRITSLVSIFSFGGLALESGSGKLSRTVSTPDLCSAQAKESSDSLQQRPFIAMTV